MTEENPACGPWLISGVPRKALLIPLKFPKSGVVAKLGKFSKLPPKLP